jgi:hypothetical protein
VVQQVGSGTVIAEGEDFVKVQADADPTTEKFPLKMR